METFCSMEVDLTWMGLWNRAVEGQLLFKERGISEAWRSGEKTLDMWANCVSKHCLSLKTFIPNFVAFFVSLGIVIFCIRRKMFSVARFGKTGVYTGRSLFHYPPPRSWYKQSDWFATSDSLVRDSEPIRLLVTPTSPSLYILMLFSKTVLVII